MHRPFLNLVRMLMLSVLFACSAFAAPAPTPATKDITIAVASTFTTLDPYDANDTLSQAVAKSFYEGLFTLAPPDMKPILVLADGYTTSSDGRVYTITLRTGVKFHDGTPFNAEAVKVNFDRVTNPANKLKRYGLFENIAKTEVVNASTVRITLKKPFSAFVNQLAHPSAVMISPTALKLYGNKGIAQHPVGTGMFKFVEWKETDYLKVAKFDGYWDKGLPKIDSITWKSIIDSSSRVAAMQTGEAQFTYPVPPEMASVLKTIPNIQVTTARSIIERYLSMNVLQKPFDNLKVRQAINYAIDKAALARVAFGGYATATGAIIPPDVSYSLKLDVWPYDVAKAKALLAEAGYPNGFETELWSAYNHSIAQKVTQFLQQQLQQVGIKTKITLLEAGQRVEKVESWPTPATAPVRLYYVGWSSSTGEADWALRPLLDSESWPPKLFNTAYYKNPKVDSDLKNALLTVDPLEKEHFYYDAQKLIHDDVPWAPLVTEELVSANSRNLSGFFVMPDGSFYFNKVDLRN